MTTLNRRSVLIGFGSLAVLPAIPALAASNHVVTIQGMAFNPAELTVKKGDTVTFTNMDSVPHSGTADNGSFDTDKLGKGQSGKVTIAAKGDIAFHCKVHPSMKGVIHAT